MEKKKIEVYIDISDNEMVGFTGPEDIQIPLVHFIDNKKIVFSKKLANKHYKETEVEYLDSYQSPNPICKGGECD